MTREEAISIMKVIVHMLEKKYDTDRVEDAVDMAIQALEQEPCNDCISRQAVLKYIEGSEAELGHSSENELVCQYIKELPPAAPKPKTGHWIFHKPFDNGHKNCNECIECSQCHTWLGYDCYAKTPFCPICGYRMIELQESEE